MEYNKKDCKEKMTSWILKNIKEDEKKERTQHFIKEVENALAKTGQYFTSWEVGYNVTQDNYAYRLYIDNKVCKIRAIKQKAADNIDLEINKIVSNSYSYEEKKNVIEKQKEKIIKRFLEETKLTEESNQTQVFIKQLKSSLENQEEYGSSWLIGENLTHEGKALYIMKDNIGTGWSFLDGEVEEEAEKDQIIHKTFNYPEKPEDFEEEYKEENNENAEAYLDKAYNSVSKKDGYIIPKSKKQIDRFKENLEKAKQEQPTAKELLDEINELEGYLEDWQKRAYYGNNTELYIVVGFIILIVIGQLTRLVSCSSDTSEPETEKSAFLIIYGILLYASVAGFYWSRKAPNWLIDKRKSRTLKFNPTGFFGKISFFFMNLMGGLPADSYTETTYYSDGSKSENTTMGPFGLAASGVLAFTIIFWIAYLHFFILLLPFWVAVGFLRNYVFYI